MQGVKFSVFQMPMLQPLALGDECPPIRYEVEGVDALEQFFFADDGVLDAGGGDMSASDDEDDGKSVSTIKRGRKYAEKMAKQFQDPYENFALGLSAVGGLDSWRAMHGSTLVLNKNSINSIQ